MANNPPPTPPTVPVVHQYTIVANRDNNPPGHATYTLLQDGVPVANYVGMSGGWDDTTPWTSKLYTNVAYNGLHDKVPSWRLTIPNRTDILLHTDYGSDSSKTSVGCLVAPPALLNKLNQLIVADKAAVQKFNNVGLPTYNAQVAAYNAANGTHISTLQPVVAPSSSININVQGDDQPATITLSAVTTDAIPQDKTGNSNTFVKLQVGLTKPLSKDVWVFVKVDNPDDPNRTEFTSANIDKNVLVLDSNGRPQPGSVGPLNVGSGVQSENVGFKLDITGDKGGASRNPSDRSQNGFWVRIPAGQTSEEVDVKPVYNNAVGATRNETFTVADYGIVYNGNSSRTPSLYQDGLNSADAHASNLLTGGQRTGASVSVGLTDELTNVGTLGSTFILPPGPGQTSFKYTQSWTFDVDPGKPHTLTLGWSVGAEQAKITNITVQKIGGGTKSLTLTQVSSGDGYIVYSIDPKQLQGTEGAITVQGKRDDAHGFSVVVDGGGQQQSPTPNLIQAPTQQDPFQANFTPPGTGTPNTTTSTFNNGVETTTTADAAGNVIYREVDNADGTREVEIYQITDQPFTSTDRLYDANSNVTSTTLYKSDGTAYLSGTGTLNADGTTKVLLLDSSGAVGGFEIDPTYYSYTPGAAAVTLYDTAGQPYPAIESDYGDYGDLRSRKYFDAAGAIYKTETLTTAPDGSIVGSFYDVSGMLIETKVTGIHDQPYVSSDSTYDSFGNLATITRYLADGTVYETGTATVDSIGTMTIVYDDASGALAEQDVFNFDGSKQISIFNVVGQPYASSVTDYDPYGRILSQTLDYADGDTYQTTTFDPNTGNTTILTYDPSGNLTSKEIDNGIRDITTYGITGEPYSAMEIEYDFAGNVVFRAYYNNDGTKEVIEYPSPFSIGSVKIDTIYDANSRLLSQTIFNIDGTVASTETVVWNADGSSNAQFRNGAGLLTSQETDGPDGSRDVTVYDVPGQTRPSTENVYDASQNLLSTTLTNADGSRSVTIFGITDQIYASAQTFYDASGTATAQNFFDSNGTLVQSDTITYGADGSTTTKFFDGTAVLTSKQIVHADGTADITAYGDAGIPYLESISHLNAAGGLISETFYNSDGSVSQTETVTLNSDGSSTTEFMDAAGNLTSRTVTAADGSSEMLNYGPGGQVDSDTFFDALGNVRSATIYNSDGSISETESVTANADGSMTTSFFDATDKLLQQTVTNADGSGTTTVYGITDEAYYSTIEATDTNGVIVSDTYLNNDGTRDVVTYPSSGLYAELDNHYDASGTLLSKQLLDDSGAIVLTGTVTTDAEGAVTTRYVDSTNTLAEVDVSRADGTRSITDYGVTGEPYASIQANYDAAGNVTSESYFNADGSLYQTESITANADDGSTALNFYDAAGTLLETDVNAADGSSDVAIFAITGQTYTSTDSQYDANGTLLSQTRNNADDTRDVLDYETSDASYATSDAHYDASGAMLTKTLLKADGSTYLVGTASTDSDGVVTIDYPDNSGNLVRQEIDNPDGTREVHISGITGQPYTSTDTFFYAFGDSGIETFYNSNQSVYRTEYFNFYADGSGGATFYGSDFRWQESDSFNSDGSKEVVLVDTPERYALTVTIYNPDGSPASATVTYPDGSERLDAYGITNKPYVSTSTYYNYFGQLTSVTRLAADGSVYEIGTPAASQDTASAFTMDYANTTGDLASIETTRVDGTSTITAYLITGQPYTSATSNYDANGNMTSETFFNADGSTYASTHSVYDLLGNLVAEAFFNGDGSVDHTVSVLNGTTTTNHFAAGGVLDHKTVTNPDGRSASFQYGITGEPYTSTERDYDSSGALTQLTLFDADGSREIDAYGITGQPYASTQSQYDAAGNLSSETFYQADGSVHLVRDLVANADGSITVTGTDGQGAVIDQTIQNADGSAVDHAYGISGQPYVSTVGDYDVNGNLTSAIFYAADGSVYQTETVSTDASGTTTDAVTNADGSLVNTDVVAADGSSVMTIYGITGLHYASMAAAYDTSGTLTSEIFFNADGSVYETETVNANSVLQVGNFAFDGVSAAWNVSAAGIDEHLTGVEGVIDGTGHRFLLVGGGSRFSTIQQAVDAAFDGDTILIAPGSYSENVSIAGKAIALEGVGGVTLHGSIAESGTLNGSLTIDGLSIDAAGQQYGVLVSANSVNFAGSVTISNSSITNAALNGFAYIEAGNGSTPTNDDTIGSISLQNSTFSGNATQTSGPSGRGDILLYGYNRDFTVNDVTISNPGAGAQKAIQVRGIQSSTDVSDVGPYETAGNISLTNLDVSGSYAQDLLAFYRIASFASFTTTGVALNASAPWGLFNFDEVGGTLDLSSGITGTNLVSGAPVAVEQGLSADSTFVGSSGNDVLVARGGNEILEGAAGNNTYLASSATGHATIDASSGSGTNVLDFTGNIADENLWFAQSGNDLKIEVMGSTTSVTVNGWFSSSSNQLQEITAGGLKIDNQLSQLVQAMATYSGNNTGFDPTSSSNSSLPHDSNLQTAMSTAWHA